MVAASVVKSVDQRVEQHAQQIDEDTNRIRTSRLNVMKMRELGTFVDLDLHGFSMFTVKADKFEFGIPQGHRRHRRLRSGTKHLIPADLVKRLNSIGQQFRQNLERWSFHITRFGSYRWIPFTAYARWREQMDSLQAELKQWKAEVIFRYDEFVADLEEDFDEIAGEAWSAMIASARRTNPNSVVQIEIKARGGVTRTFSEFERDDFIAFVVNRVRAQIPTIEQIAHSIVATYHNMLMLSESDIEQDRLAADLFRQAQAEARAGTAQAVEEEGAARRLVRLDEQEQRRTIEAREHATRQTLRLAVQEREIALKAMHAAELEHARARLQEIGSPLNEVFSALRAQIHEDVTSIAKTLTDGKLHGLTAKKARGLVETFRLLNAHEDHQLEAALQKLRDDIDQRIPAPGDRATYNVEAVKEQLQKIMDLTHQAAQDVTNAGATRAGALMV
jgi:hypothetical protein